MDANKVFDQLTWDDVVIEDGVLKSIMEFPVNELKHKELRTVCSRLKIKGVKNTMKESMIEKIVSVYKLKEWYGRLNDDSDPFRTPTRKEPQCPYRLLIFYFLICSVKAWLNLGIRPHVLSWTAASIQQSTVLGRCPRGFYKPF